MKQIKFLLMLLLVVSLSLVVGCAKPKYIVSFDTDCEQVIESQEVVEEEKATKPEDPIKEGHKFLGWFNGDTEYVFETPVTANVSLKAKWEICTYVVSFETGTEETIDSQDIKYNKKASQPEDPVQDGYTFGGWFNGETKWDFNSPVKSDLVLTAKWDKIPVYNVTFKAEGEVVEVVEVRQGKDAKAPKAPAVEGKTFVKWEGEYKNVTADVEIIAVYEVNKYTVEFKVDGVLYGSAVTVEHGAACQAPANPEKEGYKFIGWDKEFSEVKGNLVVNAQFEAIEYSIKYYNGNQEITNLEPSKYTPSDTITLTDYEVADYYFYGWFKNSDLTGDVVYKIEEGTTGDITLYALNVKADINGGKDCWITEFPADYDAGKGIDEFSDLPETFEMDFYKYLKDNNLLTDAKVHATMQADSWEKFSGLNPNHNGDPKRIWNDTSTNAAGGADGYVALFLFDTIEINSDLTVKDVNGGFLGTEPYKTKYRGLLDILSVMHKYKVENNRYSELSSSSQARAFLAFIIDGYFYGTQGAASGYFAKCRNVVPGINFSYKKNGENIEKITYEGTALPTPVKDGYAFAGWYLDQAGTKKLGESKATTLCTVYAKWEKLQ